MRTSLVIDVSLGPEVGEAKEGGGGDAQTAPEADDGDTLLAAGGTPEAGLLVELGTSQLGELLGLFDTEEGGKVFKSHLAAPMTMTYTPVGLKYYDVGSTRTAQRSEAWALSLICDGDEHGQGEANREWLDAQSARGS